MSTHDHPTDGAATLRALQPQHRDLRRAIPTSTPASGT